MEALETKLMAPTDTLVYEYVQLPIRDLSLPFLGRVTAPIPFVWEVGSIPFISTHVYPGDTMEDRMREFVLAHWRKTLETVDKRAVEEHAPWLLVISKVRFVECTIVSKEKYERLGIG